MDKWMNEWINEWMNEWMNKWMQGWINERMNKMNEWTNDEWIPKYLLPSTEKSIFIQESEWRQILLTVQVSTLNTQQN